MTGENCQKTGNANLQQKPSREQACKPNSVPAKTGGDHSSSPGIAAGIKRPTRELAGAFRPGNRPDDALRGGQPLLSYLVLLRVGFTLPQASLPARCALTLSRRSGRTISPLPCLPSRLAAPDEQGGIFSVALSVSKAYGSGFPEHPPLALAVSEHTALRSSDFPLPRLPASPKRTERQSSGRPACSRQFIITVASLRMTVQKRFSAIPQIIARLSRKHCAS